jgi:DNA invertase Pin-like site-specific DNA recombinase
MPSKINKDHLLRQAYIYIRQSSLQQVHTHLEGQRLQYRLEDRAKELGWEVPIIIDDDLGRSGSGSVVRTGFLRLLSAVREKSVGAVFCFEASRLARNNREWYQLVDHCAVVNTLLIDLDGIYDPNNVSDRVFLGMKGTMSEYELGIFRQRAQAAIEQKASRGELYRRLPVGYIRTADNRCEMDPHKRVQEAIHLVFKKFRELGSINQVVLWFQVEKIEIPTKAHKGCSDKIIWKVPTKSTLSAIIKNPIYTGAYVYGRTQTQTHFVDGKIVKTRSTELPQDQWKSLILSHHKCYISWDEYIANKNRLQQNTNKRGSAVKGAKRRGPALLAGLLRCQRCSRKLQVRYSGSNFYKPRYVCPGQSSLGLTEKCISFYGTRLEQVVIEDVLRVVEPAAICAAQEAERLYHQKQREKEQHAANALTQAEYEANRCFEQYNLADPKNRLVAANLEKRWNEALGQVEKKKQQLSQICKEYQPLSDQEQKTLYQLAKDLPQAWHHPNADVTIKKRILDTLIEEIIIDIDEQTNHLVATIHWSGGKHTQYRLKRRKRGERQNHLHPDTLKTVRELVEVASDQDIGRIFNRLKITTASGKSWTMGRVQAFRYKHGIPIYDPVEYEKKGLVNLQQAAKILDVHPMTISRLIKANILKGRQVIKYSPWMIDKEQLKNPRLLQKIAVLKNGSKIPFTNDTNQLSF